MPAEPLKLAVLVSGSGTTLQNLLNTISSGNLPAEVKIVIGSRAGLLGVKRAQDADVPAFVVDRRDFQDLDHFSDKIFVLCDEAGVDLICLAGWLCLLTVPARYVGKTMNIHPSLLPSFGGKGMYGPRVHQAVIDHGCKISGCTVHFVDGAYDSGPIILQRTCKVLDSDTSATLAHRVFDEEKVAYPQAIRLFAERRLQIEGRRVLVLPER